MPTGFFTTITAVKIDKAFTTKDKLLADIDLQQQAIHARLEGEKFNPKNSDRAFSEWFFQRGSTLTWWTYLRAGNTPIRINGGDAFEAGTTLEEVLVWYFNACQAVRAGELDAEIEATRKRRSDSLRLDKDGKPKVRAPRKRKAPAIAKAA